MEETLERDLLLNLDQLLSFIVRKVVYYLHADRCTLFLYDEAKKQLWSRVLTGEGIEEIRLDIGRGIAGHVMETGETLNIPDAYAHPMFNPDVDKQSGYRTKSILCMPLVNNRGKRIGVLQVLNKLEGEFTDRDETILEALSSQAATSIENTQLYQELKARREAECALSEELKARHAELQKAYRETEESKQRLAVALKRIQIIRIAATVLVFLLFLSAGLYHWKKDLLGMLAPDARAKTRAERQSGGAEALPTATVSCRPVSSYLSVGGKVKPLEVVNMISPIEGKVKEKHFYYGQYVEEGQVLMEIDSAQLENELRRAEAEHIRALKQHRDLENWQSSREVSDVRRSIAKAKDSLESTRNQMAQAKLLLDKGVIPASEYESLREQYKSRLLDFQSLREQEKDVLKRGDAESKRIAELELKNAQLQLQGLQEKLGMAVVRARTSGVVMAPPGGGQDKGPTEIEKGSSVSQGAIILSIGNLSGFSVKAKVDEIDVVKLLPGQEVTVTGEAFRDYSFAGVISEISSRARGDGAGDDNSGAPSFDVSVSVPSIPPEAKGKVLVGMSADLKVRIYNNDRALMAPIEAVMVEDGESFVVRMNRDTGRPEKVKVETLATTLDSVEIAGGIDDGDEIFLSPRLALEGAQPGPGGR